jgi:hypothetical protein
MSGLAEWDNGAKGRKNQKVPVETIKLVPAL